MPPPTAQAFNKLEKRLEVIEHDLPVHKLEDQGNFATLRSDIKDLGEDLGGRITALGANLQGQIDGFTRDKIRAEGIAEGLAKAKTTDAETAAKAAKPKWWAPLLRSLVTGVCAAAVGLIAWMASTIWNLEQEKITALQARPAQAVIVNPPPAAAAAPIASPP